jgi:hypothetical protein
VTNGRIRVDKTDRIDNLGVGCFAITSDSNRFVTERAGIRGAELLEGGKKNQHPWLVRPMNKYTNSLIQSDNLYKSAR